MRKISGKITCATKSAIPDGACATIKVVDCGRMDAPSITLGEQIINDPKSFPLEFEVEFDDSFLKADGFHGQYALNCRIETGEKLNFINDTRFNIVVDHEKRQVLEKMDFHVIEITAPDFTMSKISGKITCATKSEIPDGSRATIRVIDYGRMDAPAVTLGQQIIKDPKKFPIEYSVDFLDSFLASNQFHGQYAVSCSIKNDDKLLFVNDTNFNIVSDMRTKKLFDTLDFHVIEC